MKKALSKKNLWDKTPAWVRTILGKGLGIVPLPWLLGRRFRRCRAFVREAQWWSSDHIRQYQLNRLREILTLAYEKTEFYRGTFDRVAFRPQDLQSLDDVSRLPTIDKATVVENLRDMAATSVSGAGVDYLSTGGTSGKPLEFYINADRSSTEYAYLTTSWERAGYRLGLPMAVLRGRTVKPDRNGLRHEYDPILRHHYYSAFHTSDEDMGRYLRHIHTIGNCVLHAYPSSAYAFARYISANAQAAPSNVQAVILESENLYPDQLETIERILGVRAFSSYGHSEKLVLAAECEHSKDYHVWPTYGYFELLDEQGVPITTAGQEGEIVGTGFINTVMPFIRYRTGDRATYVGERCEACGRQHTVLRDIKGRWPQGELIAADGSVVSMTVLNVHDDTFRHVREYQFHQSSPGKATLCVVPTITLDAQEKQRIITNINKRLQGQVVLDLEVRIELVKTARGKQPRVIQNCHSPTAGHPEICPN